MNQRKSIIQRKLMIFFFNVIFFRPYLVLGKELEGDHEGLTVGRKSIVIEWKDEWHRRMKRFQRRARKCK